MSSLVIKTSLGNIKLTLRPDAAPVTVEYISKCVKQGLYDSTTFYRSDFVIQVRIRMTNLKIVINATLNPFSNAVRPVRHLQEQPQRRPARERDAQRREDQQREGHRRHRPL